MAENVVRLIWDARCAHKKGAGPMAQRQRARFDATMRRDTVNPDGYWWEPGEAPNEPHLSGVWVSNANAITPRDPALSNFAGDQQLRGARCRIRPAEKPVPVP